MMNKSTQIVTGALLSMLAACGPQANAPGDGGGTSGWTSLEGARIGGPFTLVDQDGKSRSWSDFEGKYRLVYFGYSYCPDVCPLDLQKIMNGFRVLEKAAPEKAAKIQPIFISVDPERDTPAVLKNYVSAFHPRLIGFTGMPEQITAVTKAFAVVYSKEESTGASDYLVSHSRTPYLFGPDGKVLALVPVDDPATPDIDEGSPQQVEKALDHWVK